MSSLLISVRVSDLNHAMVVISSPVLGSFLTISHTRVVVTFFAFFTELNSVTTLSVVIGIISSLRADDVFGHFPINSLCEVLASLLDWCRATGRRCLRNDL